MSVTIKDIANKAGVSKTTVSFAFNNPSRISAETYEKIMSIAKAEGYSPDPVARIFSMRKTQTIAFILPQSLSVFLLNPYLADTLRGIGSVCDKEGYGISMLPPFKGIITQTISNAAVDGMILMGISDDNNIHDTLKSRGTPYVTIDAPFRNNYVNVGIDDKRAAKEMMDYLLENGHRRICICSLLPISSDWEQPQASGSLQLRMQGITESIEKHNIKTYERSLITYLNMKPSQIDAYQEGIKLFTSENRPTAIFCMADIQAYGFYQAANELKLSIPDDISIVSFDDLDLSKSLTPGLTSIHQTGFDKGVKATELLFKLMNEESCSSALLDCNIEVRNSVKKIAPITSL